MDVSKLKPVSEADVTGKRVLIRVDVNVPLKDGRVTDDTRIRAIVPVVRDVLERGGVPILLAHLGRPKGKPEPALSLNILREPLEAAFSAPVVFVANLAGALPEAVPGTVFLLENVRFDAGEEKNTEAFARQLAVHGDIYVNDAFSCAHRAHASTEGLTHLLPSYAGPQMMAEIAALRAALDAPDHPVAALVGGAKISTKIPVLTNMVSKVDVLIVGGGMANTFLLADGFEIGKSLAEPDLLDTVRAIRESAAKAGCVIILPSDVVAADEFAANAPHDIVNAGDVPADRMILDVGPGSVAELIERLGQCRTLLWNGPLGAFETEPFGAGTFAVARAAAELTKAGKLTTVAGGGDTVAALNGAGVTDDFSYVSTAGGAFLEWLEGRELPGVAALAR